jgi:HlyD family secretion protein
VLDLEKQARTVDVDVRFDEVPQDVVLLIGYSADVTIVLQKSERVLRVPTEALVSGDHVWVLDAKAGVLNKRQLQLGIGNFTFTEVRSGLNEGDLVVRSPDQPGIREGVSAESKHE